MFTTQVKKRAIIKCATAYCRESDGHYIFKIQLCHEELSQIMRVYQIVKFEFLELQELKRFIKTETCDFTKITWPRHADGSCDYDGSKKAISSQTSKSTTSTNVALNKTMTVKENLKLRSGEATSTQVLTVMSAGTKVKIT